MNATCPLCGGTMAADVPPIVVESGEVFVGGERRRAQPLAARLLEVLARRSPNLVAKEALYDVLYSDQVEPPFPKILDVYVCKLRPILAGSGWRIETVWGRGWRLVRE